MNDTVRVDQLKAGDMVDLEGDPFADVGEHAAAGTWRYEYAVIGDIERETPDCIRVDFDNSVSVGFPPGHYLTRGIA